MLINKKTKRTSETSSSLSLVCMDVDKRANEIKHPTLVIKRA